MLKFALVGCGRIAHRHALYIKEVGSLIAVCDINHAKASQFATDHQTKAYGSIEELLSSEPELDVVSICTPNGLHAEHSIKTLQAGKHVLCEKPLCLTSAAAWQLVETEKFSRRKLFVVKSARFNPLLKALKNSIDGNELGKIYSFSLNCFWNRPKAYFNDWHGKLFPDGGTLYTQFSHYIDALLWLFGDLQQATGYRTNGAHQGVIEFEDTGVAACTFLNNVLGTINWSINSFEKNSEISLTVLAERGTICFGGEYLNEVKYIQSETFKAPEPEEIKPNEYANYKGTMSHHRDVYQNLAQALQDESHPFTNIFDGLKTVEAIEKIYKSLPLLTA
jgi:UDP-N-acetyl-2-amino-2-deoxyglucuronate dehydrogenase